MTNTYKHLAATQIQIQAAEAAQKARDARDAGDVFAALLWQSTAATHARTVRLMLAHEGWS
ncbi:MAG: hypothetical protein RIS45_123 [Planctomycetota bacterium]